MSVVDEKNPMWRDADGRAWAQVWSGKHWTVLIIRNTGEGGESFSSCFRIVPIYLEKQGGRPAEYGSDYGDTNPATAEWEADGFVRWDGCSHITTPSDCMTHLCGMDVVSSWLEAQRVAFRCAAQAIDQYRADIGGDPSILGEVSCAHASKPRAGWGDDV